MTGHIGSSLPQHCPGVWRGRSLSRTAPALSSGHALLDKHLPGRGWPLGALTELLAEGPGNGEFSLLLPALASLTARGRWVTLVDPPWIPYAPALHGHGVALERLIVIHTRNPNESLWACEQALRGVSDGAVLGWHDDPGFARLRRLQLAARASRNCAFLFRPCGEIRQASPAVLRLQLQAEAEGTRVRVLKCQGRRPDEALLLRHAAHVPGNRPFPRTGTTARALPVSVPDEQWCRPLEARAH